MLSVRHLLGKLGAHMVWITGGLHCSSVFFFFFFLFLEQGRMIMMFDKASQVPWAGMYHIRTCMRRGKKCQIRTCRIYLEPDTEHMPRQAWVAHKLRMMNLPLNNNVTKPPIQCFSNVSQQKKKCFFKCVRLSFLSAYFGRKLSQIRFIPLLIFISLLIRETNEKRKKHKPVTRKLFSNLKLSVTYKCGKPSTCNSGQPYGLPVHAKVKVGY